MPKMKILYYNSGWPINIGNAFIDYGSVYAIKTAVPSAEVYIASELAKWIFWFNKKDMSRSIDLAEMAQVDFIVVSGMSMCDEFIAVEGPILKNLSRRGVKIIFSGSGGEVYTEKEITNFRNFLKGLNLAGFISRDEESFRHFKDLFPQAYSGIDCAFFLGDSFKKLPLVTKSFVTYCFDALPEPNIDQPNPNIIRPHHECTEVLHKPGTTCRFLFALTKKWPFIHRVKFTNKHDRYLSEQNVLISDIPDDYLHLYANASATHSDRVHACIATLAFGNAARLYSKTPRAHLFDRVGASAVRERLVRLDMEKLKDEKNRQIQTLKNIFESEGN